MAFMKSPYIMSSVQNKHITLHSSFSFRHLSHSTSKLAIMAGRRDPRDSVVVVSPRFLTPHPVDLIITKKHGTSNGGECEVKDVKGHVLFTVEASPILSIHPRRIIRDAAGNVILTLRRKIFTVHRRWEVFRGSRNDVVPEDQPLFSVKRSSRSQFSYKLDVFLASNTRESVCDFRVKEGFSDAGCTIYEGDGQTNPTLIAQMYKKQNTNRDVYVVSVQGKVDCAFIGVLVVLLHEIHETLKS
ncbi:hypothetical protein Ancab_016751 [Ancistrocladus abbreviatus]